MQIPKAPGADTYAPRGGEPRGINSGSCALSFKCGVGIGLSVWTAYYFKRSSTRLYPSEADCGPDQHRFRLVNRQGSDWVHDPAAITVTVGVHSLTIPASGHSFCPLPVDSVPVDSVRTSVPLDSL